MRQGPPSHAEGALLGCTRGWCRWCRVLLSPLPQTCRRCALPLQALKELQHTIEQEEVLCDRTACIPAPTCRHGTNAATFRVPAAPVLTSAHAVCPCLQGVEAAVALGKHMQHLQLLHEPAGKQQGEGASGGGGSGGGKRVCIMLDGSLNSCSALR